MITIKEDKTQYQKDQDSILSFILNERFFKPWQATYNSNEEYLYSLSSESRLELFFTSSCNQKCEYCYLVKYEELYPKEYNKKELILSNLKLIYDWILENKFTISSCDFFSGEIWHTSFGLEILQITYEYLQKGMRIQEIMIPTNCTFIHNDIQTAKIQRYINQYKIYNCRLIISASVDGAVIENLTRPCNNIMEQKTEEFYEKLFVFCQHNNFFFHPMVSSKSCKYWIENYKWWKNKLEEYDYTSTKALMMLEVRNADWDDESIKYYNDFMKYLIDEEIERIGGLEQFFNSLVSYDIPNRREGYVPFFPTHCDTFAGCTVSNTLTIRVGDLAICPCHRQAYNKLLYGHFVVENNKITDISANNPYIASRILLGNNNICSFKCDTCIYNERCLKGCYGAQYEFNNDSFMPIPNVCYFFKKKWQFIITYLNQLGAFQWIKDNINAYNPSYENAQKLLNWAQLVLEDCKNVGKI